MSPLLYRSLSVIIIINTKRTSYSCLPKNPTDVASEMLFYSSLLLCAGITILFHLEKHMLVFFVCNKCRYMVVCVFLYISRRRMLDMSKRDRSPLLCIVNDKKIITKNIIIVLSNNTIKFQFNRRIN